MNNTNTVEVDGVSFETLMPERRLPIPGLKKPRAALRVQLGIRITNHTSNRLRFCFYDAFFLFPEIIGSDGQILKKGNHCERSISPRDSDFLLVPPREVLTFYPKTFLRWEQNPKKKRDRKLTLSIIFEDSDAWVFEHLTEGNYQVHFTYKQSRTELEKTYKYMIVDKSIVQEVWTGEVTTPTVEFSLLQPKTDSVVEG